ncbi:MAG TPA: glycoside hydrolase family 3 N-terminal domain-containing protein [Euzebyales bacterium]|nr:glycoside hydrolase family 3 N-terminal domain-containing protein [Euzebyales bacterium]
MTIPGVADAGLARAAAGVVLPSFAGLEPPSWILDGLAGGLAGVVLFGGNVGDAGQVTRLCARLRQARDDLIVAIDEEGGDVTRLAHATGSPYPGNAALGAADDTTLTRRVYAALGAELSRSGVTLDLAPSVDVNTAADNPVIGTRAFGSDAQLVTRHSIAAVAGLHDAGVAACVKHFPGHGATRDDSHLGLPTVDVPLDVLRTRDLQPFAATIAAGVRSVMTAHVRVPELTGRLPATLSPAALQTLLRGELGFDGVVVTDALEMRGARGSRSVADAAAEAFVAGADLLCLGPRQGLDVVTATVTAVAGAVRDGRVSRARLDEAGARIADLKAGTWRASATPAEVDRAWGLDAARAAIRMHGTTAALDRPLVVQLQAAATIAAGPVPWGLAPSLPAEHGGEVLDVDHAGMRPAEVLARAAGRSLVVVVRDAHRHPWMMRMIEALVDARPDTVLIEMGLPVWRPHHRGAYIATYGAARANAAAAAELLAR